MPLLLPLLLPATISAVAAQGRAPRQTVRPSSSQRDWRRLLSSIHGSAVCLVEWLRHLHWGLALS